MIYYFSFWYKPEERAVRIAAFLCSATLAGAFGGYVLSSFACFPSRTRLAFYVY